MATFIGLIPSKYTIYALYGTFGRLHLPNCRFYNFCICILMGLGGASPSSVFLLFFCVRLPVRANSSLAFVGLVALSYSSWTSWQCTFSFYGHLETLGTTLPIFQTDIFLPSRWHPHPVALSMVVEPGAVAACRHISHASMAVIRHHCRYGCLFPFWYGSALIFFLCKGSPSVIRQVPVAQFLIPTQIFQQPSAFSS